MKSKWSYLSRIIGAYLTNRRDSNVSFWHTPLAVNRLDGEDIKGVRRYPMNFIAKTAFKNHLDGHGVILLDYHGDLGLQYNPNAVAQQALGYYDKYLDSGSAQDKSDFLTQATYFLRKGRQVRDDVLLWEYDFPFEMRELLSAPWRSGLAQGQAISVLIRAHKLTGEEKYADLAHKGYNAFHFLAREHEGGVLDDEGGFTWLEEYIVNPPNHVLNGFVWALWGVRDYAVYFGNDHAENLWRECLKTLEANLKNYDLGFWTAYDWPQGYDRNLPVMPSSLYYQTLHTIQMEAVYNLTQHPLFHQYYLKWRKYLENRVYRAACLIWKCYFKLRYF
jgi:heparosan-N-sulfate-glucuronate 5-epimerase